MLNGVLKSSGVLKISTDVKIGAKKEIKGMLAVSYNFSQKYLENLKYNVKQACIFSLILIRIPSNLMLIVINRG